MLFIYCGGQCWLLCGTDRHPSHGTHAPDNAEGVFACEATFTDLVRALDTLAAELRWVVPPLLSGKLEQQTRRFPSAKPVEGSPNQFAPVVGYFFYPLLNGFDRLASHPWQ